MRTKNRLGKSPLDRTIDMLTKTTTTKKLISASQLLAKGGQLFLSAIAKYGIDKRGDSINIPDEFAEYLLLIGDLRVAKVLTTGAAQCGKSLGHYLLALWLGTEAGMDVLWAYDHRDNRDRQVKANFKPLLPHWLQRIKLTLPKGSYNDLTIVNLGNGSIQFEYVSTTTQEKGTASVGGNLAGVTKDCYFADERSQAPSYAWEPLEARLLQGRIPSRPTRELGTPGGGAGIEAAVNRADRDFWPHTYCVHCQHLIRLDPKGCLLLPSEVVEQDQDPYLSVTGRPSKWFHRDPNDPISSAYFGCPGCKQEIDLADRLGSHYRCIKTGTPLKQFIKQLPSGVPDKQWTVAITRSPLLRGSQLNEAARLIQDGLRTSNVANWQQQELGHASSTGSGGISLAMLQRAYERRLDLQGPETSIVIAGADQGRSDFWVWVVQVYLPMNLSALDPITALEQCRRKVLFAGSKPNPDLGQLSATYRIQFGFIDNEPERAEAARLCAANCFELADQRQQREKPKADIMQEVVKANGRSFPCYKLNTRLFMTSLRDAFALGRYSVPDWTGEEHMGDRSPVRHLSAPTRDGETGHWSRPDDHVDDLFFAATFAEAALYHWLTSNSYGSYAQQPKTDPLPHFGASMPYGGAKDPNVYGRY